jgi:hypothetical protein
MLWRSSKANPILPETTDCIQSTDYLHTKPVYSLIWTALAENDPGRQPWVNWTTHECYWQSSKANPILSETTDCIQSKDYLYTKQGFAR